jgi:hypothetical protein
MKTSLSIRIFVHKMPVFPGAVTLSRAGVEMIMKQLFFLAALFLSAHTLAADDAAAKCDAARDQAKRHYGSLRHYFDALNHCLSRNNEDANQCKVALTEQQTALGDFMFAQRVASDVCGQAGKNPTLG